MKLLTPYFVWSDDSPAVLHVGWFVHADGQFDLQLGVLAALGDDHPVELGLFRPVGAWIQDHLQSSTGRAGIGQKVKVCVCVCVCDSVCVRVCVSGGL